MLLDPQFVVADEPVSMLDVSVRAEVLNFLLDLRAERGTAFLFITHDIGVARYVSDRIAVMYLGRIVEEGPAGVVLADPLHPYTAALVAGAPDPERGRGCLSPSLVGEVVSPVDLPRGCRFAGRCPRATAACRRNEPLLEAREGGRRVACYSG
jgi:oligopeptide/dipeptide ABC transporter ATP-binding protein